MYALNILTDFHYDVKKMICNSDSLLLKSALNTPLKFTIILSSHCISGNKDKSNE